MSLLDWSLLDWAFVFAIVLCIVAAEICWRIGKER